jgi:hypothetical protein
MKYSIFCYRNSDKQGSVIPSGSLREQKALNFEGFLLEIIHSSLLENE